MNNHESAFQKIIKLAASEAGLAPDLIAHRMVHGGSRYQGSVLVDPSFLEALDKIKHLAPSQNPPATRVIHACGQLCPGLPQVVAFDTAYHATIPEYAYTCALPMELRDSLGLRKYGFHGISHEYVVNKAADFQWHPLEKFNAVSCHLGSGGASLCAVRHGRSIENTMGYSPLQGLIMSTRCGDLGPAVTMQLLARTNGDLKRVEALLNRRSGVLGHSGVSAGICYILLKCARTNQDPSCRRTAEIYLWRLRKYLGAYLTIVGSADAIIFTGTIGEEVAEVRSAMCSGMEVFGLALNEERNHNLTRLPADIAASEGMVRILVIPTNEELAIAHKAYAMVGVDRLHNRKAVA